MLRTVPQSIQKERQTHILEIENATHTYIRCIHQYSNILPLSMALNSNG